MNAGVITVVSHLDPKLFLRPVVQSEYNWPATSELIRQKFSTLVDILSIVFQVLFITALPIGIFFSVINSYVKIRVDTYKMTHVSKIV